MLIEKNIKKYDSEVKQAIDELWENAFKNQKNENDLVLIIANGSKNNYSEEILKRLKITNYQIGHDIVHFRYINFYEFFNQYKRLLNKEEFEIIENKKLYNETMVQMQLLSYMKFWEADLILKRLYNLSQLCMSKDYLWDITQNELNNRRRLVKDNIQNPDKNICPKFHNFIEDVYSRQLRNAIAHSQYYIMYDVINLTNIEENQFYKLNGISFARWEELFTKIILMDNHMIENFNKYFHFYVQKVENKQNGLRVYLPEMNSNGLKKGSWIKYDEMRNLWYWNNTMKS